MASDWLTANLGSFFLSSAAAEKMNETPEGRVHYIKCFTSFCDWLKDLA